MVASLGPLPIGEGAKEGKQPEWAIGVRTDYAVPAAFAIWDNFKARFAAGLSFFGHTSDRPEP